MKQKEEKSTTLIKLIADMFYITFLPEAEDKKEDRKIKDKYLNLLEKYINENGFNRKKFICDAKKFDKNDREIFLSLLPEELIDKDENTLNEIEAAYQNIHKENIKGGYIRAVLQVLFDREYQINFNKKTHDYLSHVMCYKENIDFSVLSNYINCASQIIKGNYTGYQWNISNVTDLKAIGSTKDGKTEKIDNPYSSYKVYAQGEYSKLLIGWEADSSLPLESLIVKGWEEILTNEKTYRCESAKKLEDSERPEDVRVSEISNEAQNIIPCKIIPYRESYNYSQTETKLNRLKYILRKQEIAITKNLQRFNNFIPYDLDTEVIVKDKKVTFAVKIYQECKKIYEKYQNIYVNFDKSDAKNENSQFDAEEIAFITRYYNLIIKNLDDTNRKEFDEKTHWKFQSKKASIKEKINALNSVIYTGISTDENGRIHKASIMQFHPQKDKVIGKNIDSSKTLQEIIEGLAKNEIWYGILNKFNSDEFKNQSYSRNEKSFLDEESNVLYTRIEKDYKDKKLSKPALELMRLFDEYFYGNILFLSTIYSYIKNIDSNITGPGINHIDELKVSMHELLTSKKEKDAFDAYLVEKEKSGACNISWDEIDERFFIKDEKNSAKNGKYFDKIGKLKQNFGMQCLDKKRSWDAAFRWYNHRNSFPSENKKMEQESFRRNMYSIYDAFDRQQFEKDRYSF